MKRTKQTIKIKIKASKVSVGHQANTHQVHDNRPKRQRTRQAQRRAAISEF